MDRRDRSNTRAAASGRGAEADRRDEVADVRERQADIREGVLDRWERELDARALDLRVVDEAADALRLVARGQRVQDRVDRRAASNERADAAIEREVERSASTIPPADAGPGVRDAALSRALERLSALTDSALTLPETLSDLLVIAVDATPGAAAATISLTVEGTIETAASTTRWAADLDAAQMRHPHSAIGEALRSRNVVSTDDLASDARWALDTAVGTHGRRSVLAVAVWSHTSPLGVLTVYAHSDVRFDSRAALIVALLGAQASLAVGRHTDRVEHQAELDAWERALESRDQIGQAKGILMEQRELDPAAAFELLRVTSQRLNVKVRTIADHVAAHRRLPDPTDNST